MLVKLGEWAPALEISVPEFNSETKTYKVYIEVMDMPDVYIYGIKKVGSRCYPYYENVLKVVSRSGIYWVCQSNDYIHGYIRYAAVYDGDQLYFNQENYYDE